MGGRFHPAAQWLFVVCGVWLIGLGLYFIFVRPPLLPEDPRFMGATLDQIRTTLPGLARWLSLVFTVMGGFMGATGALTIVIALHLESLRTPTAAAALLTAGAAGVGVMSTVNFVLQSDFR